MKPKVSKVHYTSGRYPDWHIHRVIWATLSMILRKYLESIFITVVCHAPPRAFGNKPDERGDDDRRNKLTPDRNAEGIAGIDVLGTILKAMGRRLASVSNVMNGRPGDLP